MNLETKENVSIKNYEGATLHWSIYLLESNINISKTWIALLILFIIYILILFFIYSMEILILIKSCVLTKEFIAPLL